MNKVNKVTTCRNRAAGMLMMEKPSKSLKQILSMMHISLGNASACIYKYTAYFTLHFTLAAPPIFTPTESGVILNLGPTVPGQRAVLSRGLSLTSTTKSLSYRVSSSVVLAYFCYLLVAFALNFLILLSIFLSYLLVIFSPHYFRFGIICSNEHISY